MGKYLVLHGIHRTRGELLETGEARAPGTNHGRGSVVESDIDLEKRYPEKFRRVPDTTAPQVKPAIPTEDASESDDEVEELAQSNDDAATFSAMTIEELRQYAKGEGINIPSGKTKADIIKLLLLASE